MSGIPDREDRPLAHCCGSNGPPSATRSLQGGGLVIDPTNTCDVNNLTYSAYSTHFTQPTYIHFMCFFAVYVYENHLHPVQSMFFYFMWQCHLLLFIYFMLLHVTVPILHTLHSLRTFTSCASLQYLSTLIICTQDVLLLLLNVKIPSTVALLLHATLCDSAI